LLSKINFTGLQGKISFIFISVFIVIILPVNSLIYAKVKKLLVEADSRELTMEGERLFSQVRIDPPVVPLPSSRYSIFLRVGNQFQVDSIFASPDFPIEQATLFVPPVIEYDTIKIVTLIRPVEYSNSQIYFSIARSNQPLNSQLKDLKSYLFTANLVSILVAGLLVYIVTGYSLKPIRKIIATTEQINASKSIQRVPVPKSSDENRKLALAINEMLGRIESSINNQTNFFASAAHELKTPLAVMQVELSVALQNSTDATVSILLQSQLTEVERMDRVIQDFLLISQLKSETLVLRKREELLDEVIYSAIRRCRYLTRDRGTAIKLLMSDEQQPMRCLLDFDKMETVFANLIENAIKYSPAGSIVSIQLQKNQTEATVIISNVSEQQLHDIESLKNEFKKSHDLSAGLGMGLWICDQIMKLHGGQLELSNQGKQFEVKVVL
jgi:two-component system, OmpR family, heavy metal sensor histidine kinase CusS